MYSFDPIQSLLMLIVPLLQILDWGYYIERLGSAIQKIITIPAALQQVGLTGPPLLALRLAHIHDAIQLDLDFLYCQ